MIAALLAGTARLVVGSTVYWTEPPGTEPRIYIANHSSHLDFIVLWALLPSAARARARPVAARDYWSSGVRRYLADNVFHAVLVDRGRGAAALLPAAEQAARSAEPVPTTAEAGPSRGEDAIAQMVAALDEGSSLILFPEGTRDRSGELGRFRSGLYRVATARPGVPIVPVFIANLNRIMPKGSLLPAPLLSRVTMGPPFCLDPGESRDDFLARARNNVAALITA